MLTFTKVIAVQAGDAGEADLTPPFVPDFSTMNAALDGTILAGERAFCEKAGSNVCRVRWAVKSNHNLTFTVNDAASGEFEPSPEQAPAGTVTPEIQTEDS